MSRLQQKISTVFKTENILYLFLWFLFFLITTCLLRVSPPNILDTRFYYTGEQAIVYFQALSHEDWNSYVKTAWIDLGFIFTYTSLAFMTQKRLGQSSWLFLLLGLLPGFFDFVDTMSILLILLKFLSTDVLFYLGWITAIKWTTGLILALQLLLLCWQGR